MSAVPRTRVLFGIPMAQPTKRTLDFDSQNHDAVTRNLTVPSFVPSGRLYTFVSLRTEVRRPRGGSPPESRNGFTEDLGGADCEGTELAREKRRVARSWLCSNSGVLPNASQMHSKMRFPDPFCMLSSENSRAFLPTLSFQAE